jgi:hypothetical protein
MPGRSRDALLQEFDEVVEALEKEWFSIYRLRASPLVETLFEEV